MAVHRQMIKSGDKGREQASRADAVVHDLKLYLAAVSVTGVAEFNAKPFFGVLRAVQLTSQLVAQYIDSQQQEKAENATINRELAALKRMFNLARQSTPPKVSSVPYIAMLKEDNIRTGFLESKQHDSLAAETGKIGLWLRAMFETGYT
jgi:site-specific recombinase XerD